MQIHANEGDGSVLLSPLAEVPGYSIKRYLGPVHLHFVKDSWTVRGEGTLEPFFFVFISEAHACARAQVVALGGNALLCHKLIAQESPEKKMYNMLSVSGDAVIIERTAI